MINRNYLVTALLCAGIMGGVPAAAAESASGALAKAVADPARPEADRIRDVDRKPQELIALTGIHVGARIAEILPGGGYFTRIFSKLVGPEGVVYAWVPFPAANAPAGGRDLTTPMRALAADANYPNIKVANLDPATPLPEAVDLVWTSLNYHDLAIPGRNTDRAAMNKAIFNALKPGGVYMVIDHAAPAGSGNSLSGTLHRVEGAWVRAEVEAAGFKFEAESNMLRNPADTYTQRLDGDTIATQSDKFVYRFRKPAR